MATEEKKNDTDKVEEEAKEQTDAKETAPEPKDTETKTETAPPVEKQEQGEEKTEAAAVSDDPKSGDEKKEDKADKSAEIEETESAAADTEETVDEGDKPASTRIDNLNFFSPAREDLPALKSGDIIRVSYRVIEGGKERIQVFEGTVIALKHSGIARTITVRKTSFGISVERIFPLNSKLIQKIEVKKHSKVRRAKLYYLRKLKGKAARLKELR